MTAKITKTVVTPGSTFEIGEFKGRPVVTITLPTKEGTEYVDRVIFGARKAYAVLEHLDSIRAFVAQLCETEAIEEEVKPVAAKRPKASQFSQEHVDKQRKARDPVKELLGMSKKELDEGVKALKAEIANRSHKASPEATARMMARRAKAAAEEKAAIAQAKAKSAKKAVRK